MRAEQTLSDRVAALTELVRSSGYLVALTGAGVSTESGVPDFRTPGTGLWAQVDPQQVASADSLQRDPAKFWEFWLRRFAGLDGARPNLTHTTLAALEERGLLKAVITQNIDGLHRRAGSRRVFEVHGRYESARCLGCGQAHPIEAALASASEGRVPACPTCGGRLKPDVVLFDEPLPHAYWLAEAEVGQADGLMVLGSSLEVYPVAGLVPTAARAGARLAIVNREPTPFDHLANVLIHAELGTVMSHLAASLQGRV